MTPIQDFVSARSREEKLASARQLNAAYGPWFEESFAKAVRDSAEWNPDLQAECLDRYVADREAELARIKARSVDDDWMVDLEEDVSVDYGMILMALVNHLGGPRDTIVDRAVALAKHDDVQLKGDGAELLLSCKELMAVRFDDVLDILDRHGAWENPFPMGELFVRLVETDGSLMEMARARFVESSSENLIQAMLVAFTDRGKVPDAFDDAIGDIVRTGSGETKSVALMAVGRKPALARRLEEEIFAALSADEWFIRGNAARACGPARLPAKRFVPLLAKIATDLEGCDWCPAEPAIQSLREYGREAELAVPGIKAAAKEWLDTDGCEDDEFVKLCRSAIKRIEGG